MSDTTATPAITSTPVLLAELASAVRNLLRAHDALMPGLAHIAAPDYALINDAPLAAKAILAKAERERAQRGLVDQHRLALCRVADAWEAGLTPREREHLTARERPILRAVEAMRASEAAAGLTHLHPSRS